MRRILLLTVLLLTAASAKAQSSADSTNTTEARLAALEQRVAANRVKFSGEFISYFRFNTERVDDGMPESAFVLDRWFLTTQIAVNDRVSFRGTTDIRPAVADSKHGHAIVLAYAHADWKVRPDLTLRAGMVPGGWVNGLNKVWGYRGVARVLPDDEKLLSLGVLGASAIYTFPAKRGEAGIVVHNGQTRLPESDDTKEISAYALGQPLAGLPVVAGAHVSHSDAPGEAGLDRWGGLIGLSGDRGLLALDYEARQSGGVAAQGFGVLSHLRLGRIGKEATVTAVGLADLYDPDTDTDDDERLRTVVGLAFSPSPGYNVSLDYQRYHGGDGATDAGLFVHVFVRL